MSITTDISEIRPLRILPLRFILRSEGMNFPEFSGGAWHGGLGMILAQHSPEAFRRLYQTNPESRLYALLPPTVNHVPANQQFELRITLFGHGVELALAVTQAIAELGRVGIRPGGRYELIKASMIGPESEADFLSAQDGFIAVPQIFAAGEYLIAAPNNPEGCRIQFVTPLRIKEGNDLLRTAPSYTQLLRRIFSRIDQLAYVADEAPPLAKTLRNELYDEAQRVEIKASAIVERGFERRSARSGQQMQFVGFTGSVDYVGAMQATLPWFTLACFAQVGGKTAFGFGGLEIKVTSPV